MSRPVRSAITFLLGSLIFIAIPILAWGPMDIRGFLDDQVRLSYIVLVSLLNLFAAIRIPEIGKAQVDEKTIVQRQHLAVVFLQIFTILIVGVAPYCDRRSIAVLDEHYFVRYVGLALYFIGFLAMHFAEAHLGEQFSTEVLIRKGHTLVTDGPYRYLRHPRYLGIIVFTIGLSLVFRSLFALVLAAATLLVLLWRINDEERLMHREFGTDWEVYSQRSWRLVPFVY